MKQVTIDFNSDLFRGGGGGGGLECWPGVGGDRMLAGGGGSLDHRDPGPNFVQCMQLYTTVMLLYIFT